LAKTTAPPAQTRLPQTTSFIPKSTDPRAELFFLLGTLQGRVESANRITELVIDLTLPPTPPPPEDLR